MSEQDLFAAGSAAEEADHYDALHHTLEELPGSFAAKAAVRDAPSSSTGQQAGGGAAAVCANETAAAQPPAASTPTKAEGPAPPGSPLDPAVGPVSCVLQAAWCWWLA